MASTTSNPTAQNTELWPIERRNPRKNDAAVDRMCGSIREFGFKIPCLVRSDGEVVDGHLRLKSARKLGLTEIPVILCDEWTAAQVKAFRLLVNRSATWADFDEELLALELQDLQEADYDLDLSGFNPGEIDHLLALDDDEKGRRAAAAGVSGIPGRRPLAPRPASRAVRGCYQPGSCCQASRRAQAASDGLRSALWNFAGLGVA